MIPEPGDANREVNVTETFHMQTDDELSKKELKQIEADDQAIQTILLGLPEDIYAAVDTPHQDQSSFNPNYLQQPMPNPEEITDPTTAMNMALALIAKVFKLNYSTPTNNNQRISSNPRNRQIAEPGINMGQDRQMQMVGGYSECCLEYKGSECWKSEWFYWCSREMEIRIRLYGNLVAVRAEGNATGQNGNQIRCYNYRGVGHYARNCTIRPRRRDAVYLQTQLLIAQKEEAGIRLQAEKYDLMAAAANLDEIKEYTELLEPIPEPQQVLQNNNVISEDTSVEQGEEIVEQHPANFEETRALYESLYQNLAIEVEKVNSVNRKLKETNANLTTELARYKNQERLFSSKISFHQALDLIFKLDEATVGCTQDILRQRDSLDQFSEVPWVVPIFVVIEGERETLLDVVRTSGCRYGVFQSFLVEINGVRSKRHHIVLFGELNGVHVALVARKMIPEPGDANRDINITESSHLQIDDELSDKELKQIEADDQAIQTILLGLPEDIYAAVDREEGQVVQQMGKEIWLRVQQMMKGSDNGIQEKKAKLFNEWKRFTSNEGELIESYYHRFLKLMNDLKRNKHFPEKIASNLKFLNNLQPEWSRHVTIVHQTKDLHTADYTQLYDFLKYNQKGVDELKAERLAKTQDPLALMANSNNPYVFPAHHQDQSSFNQNYLQQPMTNLEDIIDPITAMNMALALMAKAFKLNYLTPTNNNQRISSNTRNRQIAQPGMNMGQDRQMQMVGGDGGNQLEWFNWYSREWKSESDWEWGVGYYARNCTVRPRRMDAAYLQTQLLIAQKEEAGIQLQAEKYDLMAAAADLDEIEKVNANCILMANLQQASTSGTQTDSALVYDTDGSAEVHENCDDNEIFNLFTQEEQYTELLEPIPKSHQVS
uniref:Gag-Pol polyprotein n=1 Tax=Tanacetum cinerariifolium TaxID=118510 RepID=A0A6L2NCR0_TANCI|nr:hypothetical protein [Tanacetum cinerariifolium]